MSIELVDSVAEYMGKGMFVLCQPSDQGPQSVVVSESDLRRLLAALGR